MYGSTISSADFEVLFLKIPKIPSSVEDVYKIYMLLQTQKYTYPSIQKNIHYRFIAVINKYFEVLNDLLKIIRILYNCTKFCPNYMHFCLYHCVK